MSSKVNRGLLYEKKIYDMYENTGLIPETHRGVAGSSSHKADVYLYVKGEVVPFEIKLDNKARFGSASLGYSNGTFQSKSQSINNDFDIINTLLSSNIEKIENALSFFNADSIPFTTTKETWTSAINQDVIKQTNFSISSNTDFIVQHYNSKGTNYIHCGGYGLYYLGEDKFNLGVPPLAGDVKIYIRLTRGGSRKLRSGVRVVYSTLRIEAKVTNLKKSPYDLENVDQIVNLFS